MTYAAQSERGGDARVGESRSRERRPSTADPRNQDTCLVMNSDARHGLCFPTGLRSRKLHRATRDPLPSSLKARPRREPGRGAEPGASHPEPPPAASRPRHGGRRNAATLVDTSKEYVNNDKNQQPHLSLTSGGILPEERMAGHRSKRAE